MNIRKKSDKVDIRQLNRRIGVSYIIQVHAHTYKKNIAKGNEGKEDDKYRL